MNVTDVTAIDKAVTACRAQLIETVATTMNAGKSDRIEQRARQDCLHFAKQKQSTVDKR